MIQTRRVFGIFDRDAKPNVVRSKAVLVPFAQISGHKGTALRKNLISVPRRLLHGVKHRVYEGCRYLFVKKVTHRIYEDTAGLSPAKRLLKTLGPKLQIEAVLKWMTFDPTKSL